MAAVQDYIEDFVALFFPELCAGCGACLFKNEQHICTNCIYHLPLTNFHRDPLNKAARQLWGRLQFEQASSYVYFRKDGRVRNIMHQLKYNKNTRAGFRMGQLYAYTLSGSGDWKMPDLIIPVPLHPSKLRKRGYNQSAHIADGMASVLDIPVITDALLRVKNTLTQTKRSRFARYENLLTAFICRDTARLINKHVLLVDDVMTTGATLEAAGTVLLEIPGLVLSIATIAYTE